MLLLLFGIVGGRKGFVVYHTLNPFNLFSLDFDEWLVLVTIVVSLALSLFVYRPFCYLICPFGFFSWLAERLSLARVRIDPAKCTKCGACIRACPSDAAKGKVDGRLFIADCTSCARCLNSRSPRQPARKNQVERIPCSPPRVDFRSCPRQSQHQGFKRRWSLLVHRGRPASDRESYLSARYSPPTKSTARSKARTKPTRRSETDPVASVVAGVSGSRGRFLTRSTQTTIVEAGPARRQQSVPAAILVEPRVFRCRDDRRREWPLWDDSSLWISRDCRHERTTRTTRKGRNP